MADERGPSLSACMEGEKGFSGRIGDNDVGHGYKVTGKATDGRKSNGIAFYAILRSRRSCRGVQPLQDYRPTAIAGDRL